MDETQRSCPSTASGSGREVARRRDARKSGSLPTLCPEMRRALPRVHHERGRFSRLSRIRASECGACRKEPGRQEHSTVDGLPGTWKAFLHVSRAFQRVAQAAGHPDVERVVDEVDNLRDRTQDDKVRGERRPGGLHRIRNADTPTRHAAGRDPDGSRYGRGRDGCRGCIVPRD